MGYAFAIEPIAYNAFEDEAAQIEQCKEWGLLSEKASKTKAFFYKRGGQNLACTIIGFVDQLTAVIEFDNGQKHCIHPSYLKEMQAANYGQKLVTAADESAEAEGAEPEAVKEAAQVPAPTIAASKTEEPAIEKPEAVEPEAEEAPKGKAKKEKAPKIQLPEEKVKMTATVKEFATVPNHFTETDDEVIIYEPVSIAEPAIDLGAAWSSHSATLKKLELAIGDTITFEAKIVAKKLTKHPVPYKINNPAKIQKEQT